MDHNSWNVILICSYPEAFRRHGRESQVHNARRGPAGGRFDLHGLGCDQRLSRGQSSTQGPREGGYVGARLSAGRDCTQPEDRALECDRSRHSRHHQRLLSRGDPWRGGGGSVRRIFGAAVRFKRRSHRGGETSLRSVFATGRRRDPCVLRKFASERAHGETPPPGDLYRSIAAFAGSEQRVH
jgi:hypothetical protein